MSLEAANYIKQFNTEYPESNSPRSEGDDHLKLIKRVLVQSFPNINEPMTRTSAQLNKAPYDKKTLIEMLGIDLVVNGEVPACQNPSPEIKFGWHASTKRLRALVNGTIQTGGLITEGDFTGGKQQKASAGFQEFPGGFCFQSGTFSLSLAANVPQNFSIQLQKSVSVILYSGVQLVGGITGAYLTSSINASDQSNVVEGVVCSGLSGTRAFRYLVAGFI